MSKEPNRNVYVGHRYVPKIMGEWDKTERYEGLSIVLHQGHSYTSNGHVPPGIDINDERFWALTGNYNAQVEQYRQEVYSFNDRINDNKTDIDNHSGELVSHDTRIKANKTDIDNHSGELVSHDTRIKANKTGIDNHTNTLSSHDTRIKANKTENEVTQSKLDQVSVVAPKPTGSDDTEMLRDFFSEGHKNVQLQEGTYNINIDGSEHRNHLAWFTNEKDITIKGNNTLINDTTVYGSDKLVNIFAFTNCHNIDISGIEYKGLPVDNPNSELHRKGATFSYFETGSSNINVELYGENIRYGVRSGDYLNPDYGRCKNFNLNIQGEMIGYPVCVYYGDNVNTYVEVDGFHRGHYLAGVLGGNIVSKCKNIYGEITHVLLTNTITTWHASDINMRITRGSSNLNIYAEDTGSTVMHPNTLLVQIALAWVSPGTEFDNINVDGYVKSRNGVSDKVGLFAMQSAVKNQRPEYNFNYEPHVKFRNIKVKGLIDRTGQTVSTNALGELFIRLYDADDVNFDHVPDVENIEIDFVYKTGSVQTRTLYVDAPKGKNIKLSNINTPNVNISTSGDKVIFENCSFNNLSTYQEINELYMKDSEIASSSYENIKNLILSKNSHGVFQTVEKVRILNVKLNGTQTQNITDAFLRGHTVKSVMAQFRGYSESGTWSIGDTVESDSIGTASFSTSGNNRFSGANFKKDSLPKIYNANEDIVLTFNPYDSTEYPDSVITIFILEETNKIY